MLVFVTYRVSGSISTLLCRNFLNSKDLQSLVESHYF